MAEYHAVLSPSGASRWGACSGAPAMEKGEPATSSAYADEGTAAHALLRALHGLDPDAEHTLASFLQPRAEAVAASRLGALEPELLRHIWWDLS